MLNCEPWQGHLKMPSAVLKATEQPRWGQRVAKTSSCWPEPGLTRKPPNVGSPGELPPPPVAIRKAELGGALNCTTVFEPTELKSSDSATVSPAFFCPLAGGAQT